MKRPKKSPLANFEMSTLLSSKVKFFTKNSGFGSIEGPDRIKRGTQLLTKTSKRGQSRAEHVKYSDHHPQFQRDLARLFKSKNKSSLPRLKGRKLILSKTTDTRRLPKENQHATLRRLRRRRQGEPAESGRTGETGQAPPQNEESAQRL